MALVGKFLSSFYKQWNSLLVRRFPGNLNVFFYLSFPRLLLLSIVFLLDSLLLAYYT